MIKRCCTKYAVLAASIFFIIIERTTSNAVVVAIEDNSKSGGDGNDASHSSSQGSTNKISSSSFSSFRFQYSDDDLEACAKEVVEAADENDSGRGISSSGSSCSKLYDEFRLHYRGIGPVMAIPTTTTTAVSPSSESAADELVSSGFTHFKNTVRFVHDHNSKNNPYSHHKLRLNQFADTSSQSYSLNQQQEDDDSNSWQKKLEQFWNEHMPEIDESNDDENENDSNGERRKGRSLRWEGTNVRLLDTTMKIDEIEEELQQQEQQQQQLRRNQHRRSLIWNQKTRKDIGGEPATLSSVLRTITTTKGHTKVMLPGDGTNVPAPFSSPQVPTYIHGTEVELHIGSNVDKEHVQEDNDDMFNEYTEVASTLKGVRNNPKFSTRLDWSTEYNPDGVPLVHDAFDQGSCGSCWAFAATGSVEASAARNEGRNHFVKGLQDISDSLKNKKKKIVANIEAADDDDDNYDDDINVFDDDDDDDDDAINENERKSRYDTLVEELTKESRDVEMKTFKQLKLSIQQLLECDTEINEGCIGGNPLLAFYYIYKIGLVSWNEYTYVGYDDDDDDLSEGFSSSSAVDPFITTTNSAPANGISTINYPDDTFPTLKASNSNNDIVGTEQRQQNEMEVILVEQQQQGGGSKRMRYAPICQKDLLSKTNTIATVESWGLLHKDHEQLIEYALKYVGPVAVGFNGADPKFINYGGGIYDSQDCGQTANHALLIVGYDHDDIVVTNPKDGTEETKTVRYWIARNSWGKGWGENGFVKIKRGNGKKDVPGVCGIARSPSVALGGVYRGPEWTEPLFINHTTSTDHTASYRHNGQYVDSYDSSASWQDATLRQDIIMTMNVNDDHPVCDTMFTSNHLYIGCMRFMNTYERNQPTFLALIGLLVASIAMAPLAISIWREHQLTLHMVRLEKQNHQRDDDTNTRTNGNTNSIRSTTTSSLRRFSLVGSLLSSPSHSDDDEAAATEIGLDTAAGSPPTERTHLLTLKDMYASQREKEQEDEPRYFKPRGRSIIIENPTQDPFHLVPSATSFVDNNNNNNNINNTEDEEDEIQAD